MPHFTQYKITLHPEGPLTGWLGHLLHGALFTRIDETNPALGQVLHDQNRKPFSLRYTLREGAIELFVNVWDDALRAAIPAAFLVGSYARLSQTNARIVSVVLQGQLRGNGPAPCKSLCLRFITPTCFQSNGRTLLFPEGRLLCESLRRDWVIAGGGAVPDDAIVAMGAALYPTGYQLQTEKAEFGKFALYGFRGTCEYAIDPALSPELRAKLWQMLCALPYTGVGYKTAQGMGAVVVDSGGKIFYN